MAFDPNRWTIKTQEAVQAALESARQASNPEVTPEHLLAALVGQSEGVVLPVLQKLGVDLPSLRNRLAESLSRLPRAYGSDARLSRDLTKVMDDADEVRETLSDEYLSTEHLLLAMAERVGVGREDLLGALQQVRGSHRVTSQNPEGQYQALERYGRDLTEVARKGKLDPVIGRDDEILSLIHI